MNARQASDAVHQQPVTTDGSAAQRPPVAKRRVSYGMVAYPGIGYKIGSRQMVTTVMTPVAYIGTVGPREAWDPLAGTGTNRKEDKAHVEGIARYIEETEDYVLNALLVYVGAEDAYFEPDNVGDPISPGVFYLKPGAKMKVGDGGHRTTAYVDEVNAHSHGDEVLDRLSTNGQPIIVVLDDDRVRRAQDFTDLQNNAKPLNASIAQSMDRRQRINQMLIEDVIKKAGVPIFGVDGSRVEFLTDSPGKLSSKVMGFKTLRYATGTLLIGTAARSTRAWEEAVALNIATNQDQETLQKILDLWEGFGALPDVATAISGSSGASGVVTLRQTTWLTSANVIYALAAAVHKVTDGTGVTIQDAMKAASVIDFSRVGTTFHGTLVEPASQDNDGNPVPPKALTGRDAWEGAAKCLAEQIEGAL